MNRFNKKRKSLLSLQGLFLPLVIFASLFIIFNYGISSLSQTSTTEEMQSLETAINHAIVHCYSTEGTYPENLDYIIEHYGITYDKTKFLVDYKPFASNIMPEVTVVYLEDQS